MELIKELSHFFLLTLAFGTQAFYPLVSSSLTGAGFIRLLTAVSLGALLISGLIWLSFGDLQTWSILVSYGIGLLAHILMFFLHKDQRVPLCWFLYVLQMLAYCALGHQFYTGCEDWLMPIYFFTTAALLGITNYAMILGHYYLVVPKLSEKPLLNAMKILWGVLGVKVILMVIGGFEGREFFIEGSQQGSGFIFNWIVLSMRFLWGHLALGVLSIVGYKLSKMRSIQSATGIFYVMDFFVFVGELMAAYFVFEHGVII